jgi:hypothetical protein
MTTSRPEFPWPTTLFQHIANAEYLEELVFEEKHIERLDPRIADGGVFS